MKFFLITLAILVSISYGDADSIFGTDLKEDDNQAACMYPMEWFTKEKQGAENWKGKQCLFGTYEANGNPQSVLAQKAWKVNDVTLIYKDGSTKSCKFVLIVKTLTGGFNIAEEHPADCK